MLVDYKVKKSRTDDLCALFHKALSSAELLTGVAQLKIGNFVVKPTLSVDNAYSVYHNDLFLMCVKDGPGHTFLMSVHEDSYMTMNMCKIVLDCLNNTFKQTTLQSFNTTKEKAVDMVRNVIADSTEYLSNKEIDDMSELLYGEENQKQLESL